MTSKTLRGGLVIAFLVGSALAIAAPAAWHWLEVDACLDSGGRWVYHEQACEPALTPEEKMDRDTLLKLRIGDFELPE
jgi:hypothetical protein